MENMFDMRKNEERRLKFIEENSDVAEQIINTNPAITILKNEGKIPEESNDKEQLEESPEVEKQELTKENVNSLLSTILEEDGRTKDSFTYYIDKSIDGLIMAVVGNNNSRKKSKLVNLLLKSAILENDDIRQMAETNKDIQKNLDKLK
jgi:hypothetical protein